MGNTHHSSSHLPGAGGSGPCIVDNHHSHCTPDHGDMDRIDLPVFLSQGMGHYSFCGGRVMAPSLSTSPLDLCQGWKFPDGRGYPGPHGDEKIKILQTRFPNA